MLWRRRSSRFVMGSINPEIGEAVVRRKGRLKIGQQVGNLPHGACPVTRCASKVFSAL